MARMALEEWRQVKATLHEHNDVQKVELIVRQDSRVKEIADIFNVWFGTAQAIITSNLNRCEIRT